MFSQKTRQEFASGVTVLDVVDVIDGILIHGISFPTCSGAGIISLVFSMAMISSFQNQIKLYSCNFPGPYIKL